MATIADEVPAMADIVAIRDPSILDSLRRFFAQTVAHLRRLLPANVNVVEVSDLNFAGRVRMFLWLSCGLFSAGSFVISALGYLAFSSADHAGANFLAAIVSAFLFGVASVWHFGPDVA
ncbi:MAG TPA: hypothetical protein VJP06_05315 [Thermoplasmata archaeon]|nr:hypothetical protein [Thermoplasmata archaeon]